MTAAPPAPSVRKNDQPFSKERNAEIIARFNRDGYVHVGNVLSAEEVAAARAAIDRIFDDPSMDDRNHKYGDIVMTRLFELDRVFVDLITREPLIGLMEQMLGKDCHIIANNAVRNAPGQAIDDFHADDFVWFPLPPEIPRHDPRITLPNFLVNCTYALTDIPSDEYGPLQVVPGSHYSGRQPEDKKNPSFDGRGPVSVHAKAGDLYLQHPQVWHRGAPNTSNRTRYITGFAWAMRFVAQRFYPFLNYQVPHWVLEGADERMLRALGKHGKGPYG
jgi:ectoine hydroxylase-related dioxygenase (phytanoyl-CoA dioxygenase family)